MAASMSINQEGSEILFRQRNCRAVSRIGRILILSRQPVASHFMTYAFRLLSGLS